MNYRDILQEKKLKDLASTHLLPRLFLESDLSIPKACKPVLEKGAVLSLPKEQGHYLGNVLRRKIGDFLRVFNGSDGEWLAKLTILSRKECVIEAVENLRPQTGLKNPKQLLFSPLKRDATELAIRMGTELGVVRFRPLIMARTNIHQLNDKRLRTIAIEASEQSERLDIPEIMPIEPLCAVLAQWPSRTKIAVALERSDSVPPEKISAEIDTLLIGPEGGFSPEERQMLLQTDFCRIFSLGTQILKADTAIIAALARLDNV